MRVYQTFNPGEAQHAIFITQNRNSADLCVFLTKNQGLAYGEACWFLAESKITADKVLYFGNRGASRLSVCFVRNQGQAGWQRPHPLQGRLAL